MFSSHSSFLVVLAAIILLAGCAQQASEKGEVQVTTSGGSSRVLLKTTLGDITVELDHEKAPISAKNFEAYVRAGFYDGTIFHRVIDGFMIQGGGFTADMVQKPTNEPIRNEAENGLKNLRGTLAMARTNVVNSATSQFFINVVDNDFLNYQGPGNYGYAVFGKVVEGMDVVDAIRVVPTTTRGPHRDVPREPITIEKATLVD